MAKVQSADQEVCATHRVIFCSWFP